MRILILFPGNDRGGAERAAAQIADEAARRGHDVVVGTPEPGQEMFGAEQHTAARVHAHPSRKWDAPRAVADIRRVGPDVVYSFHRWTTLLAGVAALARGAPVVHHAQTMVGRRWGTWWGDRTIAVSEAMRSHVIRCGAQPERVEVIRNGAEPREIPRQTLGRTPRIVAASRLVNGKGIDHLLHALVEIPGAALTILGDGPQLGDLESLAQTLGVGERVQFSGWVPDPWECLGAATIGVVPTDTYPEGLPLAATEMLMAGLPIVITDVPGLREISDGRTARLVPAGDAEALVRVMRDLLGDVGEALTGQARDRAMVEFNAHLGAGQVVDRLELMAGERR